MSSGGLTRRSFVKRSTLAAAGLAAGTHVSPRRARAATKDKKYILGMMGTGGRGTWLLVEDLTKRPDVEIAWLSDPDEGRLNKAAAEVERITGQRPKTAADFRRILDDKNVNVFFNVTPDHWHALGTIVACQAGKDVYVEKPASHSVWEGRKMVEAARKHQRIVQLGTQTRSGPYTHKAVEFLRSGQIGDIHLVRVFNMKDREFVTPQPDGPVPPGVDYDMWLGPAPKRPFNPNHFHYKWHWFWEYSGGDIINDGIHQIDVARMLIGKDYPKAVSSVGGKLAMHDAQETPDTQVASWEYDDLLVTFELTLWTPHMKKTLWAMRDTDEFPDWRFNATKVEIHGTKGMMMFGRHGGGWQAWDTEGREIANGPGRHPHGPHIDNFFACVESRARPNADIEEGHRSTILAQMANISYRVGRRLVFDPKTETFVGDDEANWYVKRTYRDKWCVPEEV